MACELQAGMLRAFGLLVGYMSVAVLAQGVAIFPPLENLGMRSSVSASSVCGVSSTQSLCFDQVCRDCTNECVHNGNSNISSTDCLCPVSHRVPLQHECCDTDTGANCVPRFSDSAHPAEVVLTGGTGMTWASEPGIQEVNFTVDLLAEQELMTVRLSFEGRPPAAMAIMRSVDGEIFTPYQYYAWNCETEFGMTSGASPSTSETAVCSTLEPSADSLLFRTLDDKRPPTGSARDYPRNEGLQRFTRAKMIRIQFLKFHTAQTAKNDFGGALPLADFYEISALTLSGRCSCNGHASECIYADGKGKCDCQHNTTGDNCAKCLPLYNDQPYARGIQNEEAQSCQLCECNGQSSSCEYDANDDSGVCIDCAHNTIGKNCESCASEYYQNSIASTIEDTCIACDCDPLGSVGSDCALETGQCVCKTNVVGRACDECIPGSFALSESGCQPCSCNIIGVNDTGTCDDQGNCFCLEGYTGDKCDQCAESYYKSGSLCLPCSAQCGELGCINSGSRLGSSCVDCKTVEHQGICVETCPYGMFNFDGHCSDCHPNCKSCIGPEATTDDCLECTVFSHEGLCVTTCPAGAFISNGTCLSCSDQCEANTGCRGQLPSECFKCASVIDQGTCKSSCPNDKYAMLNSDGTTPSCEPCHFLCDPTMSCSGASPFQCGGCSNVTRTGTGECLSQCGNLEYEADGVCYPCDSNCMDGCNGPTASDCIGRCAILKLDDKCVNSCPTSHFVKDNTLCLPCSPLCGDSGCTGASSSQCNACGDSFDLVVDGQSTCVDECIEGTFPDQANICQSCPSVCAKCNSTSRFCEECAVTSWRYDGQCVSKCPDDTFESSATRTCIPCDPQCDGCFGPTNMECQACQSVKFNDTCLTVCPSMHFRQTPQDLCLPCDKECRDGCFGDAPSECFSCANKQDAETGLCLAECPVGTYEADTLCYQCHEECGATGCTGSGPGDCNECLNVVVEATSTCVSQCPVNTYNDDDTCKSCNALCDQACTGPTTTDCLDGCKIAEFDGECLDECPLKFYARSRVCQPCNDQCGARCTGPEDTDCAPTSEYPTGCSDLLASEGSCTDACQTGEYIDATVFNAKVCRACHPLCRECTGPGIASCTQCTNKEVVPSLPLQSDPTVRPQCTITCGLNFFSFEPLSYDIAPEVCAPCDENCDPTAGCTGPLPTNCAECKDVVIFNETSGGTCAASCISGTLLLPGTKECHPCHPECQDGCSEPLSESHCTTCANYKDGSKCVATCPTDRPFLFKGACTAECPSQRAYYNDTRDTLQGDGTFMPRLCVSACLELGMSKRSIAEGFPFRCTTEEQAAIDVEQDTSTDKTAGTDLSWTYLAIGIGVFLLIVLIIALMVAKSRRKNAKVALETKSQSSSYYDAAPSSLYEPQERNNAFDGLDLYQQSNVVDSSETTHV